MADLISEIEDHRGSILGRRRSSPVDFDSMSIPEQLDYYKLNRYRANTVSRNYLSIWVAGVVSLWLIGVFWLLLHNEKDQYCLSDTVLVTLLGTTTLNILGLPLVILRGLFQPGPDGEGK